MSSDLIKVIPSERTLGVASYNPPDYDPEIISVASLEDAPSELKELQSAIKKFLNVNAKHWSASTLSQFLGIDIHTLKALAGNSFKDFNTERAHTILVLKPIEDAEIDNIKFQGNLL